MKFRTDDIPGMRVTVMGLGLSGGGLESARFFARRGADVTVTDLRGEEVLAPSLEALAGLPIRYVLGRHEIDDFRSADLVIKNPAVKPDSPFLAASRRVETDLSVFLSLCRGPVLAVTGSKGKSSTAAAMHFVLRRSLPGAFLGGNIATSPLSFVDEVREETPVVLELSSWQLGDLRGRELLRPRVAVITNILPDHLDRYGSMEPYVADKRLVYAHQTGEDHTVVSWDDPYGRSFGEETPGRAAFFSRRPLPPGTPGAFLAEGGGRSVSGEGHVLTTDGPALIVPRELLVRGEHQRLNLLAAGLALVRFGLSPRQVAAGAAEYPGIEHRLELCGRAGSVLFYNDSAATIPEALTAAVKSFTTPLLLITGGTDKVLDFSVFAEAAPLPRGIFLLEGSATVKIRSLLDGMGIPYRGPYDSLEAAVRAAAEAAAPGDSVLFSPGCTSFGMFLNEFDRGRRFKDLVARLAGEA